MVNSKIPVGILGATGVVGQRFIQLLENHPWFEVSWLAASERSEGKPYAEAASWRLATPVPERIAKMQVSPAKPDGAPKVIFAALDSGIAKALEPLFAEAGCAVVSNSTSCGLMLKREAREILEVEDEDLTVVSEAMYDLCEFLLLLHERGELRTDFKPLELTVPYHAPCQQQGHGIGKPALDLFALIPGLRAIELDATCCGISGTYGFKKEKYEIGMTVGERLFGELRESNGDLAACDSETCRWQIAKATDRPAVHPIDLLHRAYGL